MVCSINKNHFNNSTQHEVRDEGRASNDPPLPMRERPLQQLAKSHPGEDGMIDGTANQMIKILGSRCGPTNGKEEVEREGNRQADNSGESDVERLETQDEVQTDDNSKRDKQEAHILLSEKQKSKKISDDHHIHLILQAQAVANSTQTSLQSTFTPSVESSSGFDLIQKEQELDKEEKVSRQNRHIVNDNHNISYKKIGNSNFFMGKGRRK